MKAVILLSGGLDSATVLAIARSQGRDCYALSFNYGQRHSIELEAASKIASSMQVKEHRILDLPIGQLGGSSLTGSGEVPKGRSKESITTGIPNTYVPARNTIFLAIALGWCEILEAHEIWIGVNALDYSGYPDCRAEFIAAFQGLARLGTRIGIENPRQLMIQAPLQYLSKADIIRKGMDLGVDFSLTRSCYDPPSASHACGRCDACILRKKGFQEAGLRDPIQYANEELSS